VCVCVCVIAVLSVQAVLESPDAQAADTAGVQLAAALAFSVYGLREWRRLPLGACVRSGGGGHVQALWSLRSTPPGLPMYTYIHTHIHTFSFSLSLSLSLSLFLSLSLLLSLVHPCRPRHWAVAWRHGHWHRPGCWRQCMAAR
jgi:hypothetical protein